MAFSPSRARAFGLASSLTLVLAALVLVAGPAQASTCPTVDPSTHVVTPAPTPGVQWSGCDLDNADLAGADMSSGNLFGATLTNANLTGANLKGLDLARNSQGR